MRSRHQNTIDEMKLMLNNKNNLTLESFVMPRMEEHDDMDDYEDEYVDDEDSMMDDPSMADRGSINGIEKELTQIRKIALSVINRLADKPTCPQYDTMKKITWSTKRSNSLRLQIRRMYNSNKGILL